MTRKLAGELSAEFLGTMVLIVLGDGVVAMVVLFGSGIPGEVVKGGYTNITLGWGLAVTMGIYVAGKISGAHLNPAVTLALAIFRKFPWPKVLPYTISQLLGALAGASLVFLNYLPAFRRVDPTLSNTAVVFTNFPALPRLLWAGLVDQIIGTAILMGMILAINHERHQPPGPHLTPRLVGVVVVALGVS